MLLWAPVAGAEGAYEQYRAQRTFGSLDGLRCFSIAVVVWHHGHAVSLVHELWPAARYGFLGVDLFFEISGFLIVTLLLRERERRGTISLRNFYVRRALRIWPVYYGIIAALALLFLGLRRGTPAAESYASDLPVLVLYLSNWIAVHGWLEVTWSLAAEEQFYLLWPPVEAWFGRHALALLAVIVILGEIISLGWIDGPLQRLLGWGPDEPRMLRETTFTPICLGVLLAHALHRRAWFERVRSLVGSRLAAPILLVALVLVCNLAPADVRGWPRLGLHVLMLGLLAACVVREDHALRRLLTWRPIVRVGTLSYGIYLFHQPCITAAEKLVGRIGGDHPLLELAIAGVLVWLVAEISFRFYEARFLRLKDRFAA